MIHVLSELAQFVSLHVAAAPPPPVDCPPSLPSCGSENTVMLVNILLLVVEFVVDLAVALSLLFVLWSGLSMVLAMGDDSKTSKAKTHIFYALGGVFVALSSQSIYSIFIQNYDSTVGPHDFIFGGVFPTLAEGIVLVFNPLFILSIIVAAIRMVIARGKEEDFNKAKSMLIWSIAGAVVINLAYTIVKFAVDLAT